MTAMSRGLILALGSALAMNLSFLFKQRGAVLADPIHVRHPLTSATRLCRSRWFAIGWAVSVLAWLMHVGALSRAPLSTVQAVLSGGSAFLAVLAERFFGFHLGRCQWLGVMITAAGLTIVGLSGGGRGPGRSSLAALIAVESAVFALGAPGSPPPPPIAACNSAARGCCWQRPPARCSASQTSRSSSAPAPTAPRSD